MAFAKTLAVVGVNLKSYCEVYEDSSDERYIFPRNIFKKTIERNTVQNFIF
jgi:hypothetical protein